MRSAVSELSRLSTGSREFDAIISGGIPVGSVTVVTGEPGVGKTVLVLQMLFRLAAAGKKCLYFTTLSEPALKLVRYLQVFSFFDQSLLDSGHVQFIDLGAVLREVGAEAALDTVVARVEELEPTVVVIDSFKAIHDILPDVAKSRAAVYDLSVRMATWGATTVLVGEYVDAEVSVLPEFAIADGIIRLHNSRVELTTVREVEVVKLRGSAFVAGTHFFEIQSDGVHFYPRVRTPSGLDGEQVALDDRVSTGTAGLDAMLDGGLPRASATVVEGGTGTGKTLVSLAFLVEGAKRGEPGILLTLEESLPQLRAIASAFGWDLAGLQEQGLLTVVSTSPVELSTDRFLFEARRRAASCGARRAVLDSLSALHLGVVSERRFRELVYSLVKHFRVEHMTLLLTLEVPELLGTAQLTGHGVSSVADNMIRLRYVEVGGELQRSVSVLKARGVRHDVTVRLFTIGAVGPEVGPPFRDLRGVLTGIPVPTRT
jgi:circadian clock protein KaiC